MGGGEWFRSFTTAAPNQTMNQNKWRFITPGGSPNKCSENPPFCLNMIEFKLYVTLILLILGIFVI